MRLSSSLLIAFTLAFIQCKVKAPDNLNESCVIGAFVFQKTHCTVADSSEIRLSGTLVANDLEMKFQYGSEVARGLQDTKEYIEQSFRAYHYRKFFDYIHLDAKVHKIYRDSVAITQIRYIPTGDNKECPACNVELALQFRNKIIPFAIFITPALKSELDRTTVSRYTTKELTIKRYYNEETSGAFVLPAGAAKKTPGILIELMKGQAASFDRYLQHGIRIQK
jgi:hypothetical protein